MGWVVFFVFVAITSLIAIPKKMWRSIWTVGAISIIILYLIDTTLITLGAYEFKFDNISISEIPILYLISGFFGGAVLVRFYPNRKIFKLVYIVISSLLFIALELIMINIGYFVHLNWNIYNSFILNVFGFIIVIWFWEWINKDN